MGVEAIQGQGQSRARIVCDTCGRADVVACDYERKRSGEWQVREGQAHKKAIGHGWALVSGRLYCPACEAKRKTETCRKDIKMTLKDISSAVTPIRRPTPKQERLIILALEDAYDDQAKRYKGGATDKTVADELADGIMFGWVSEIRERLFGPSGANEEMDAVRSEIAKINADVAKRTAELNKRLDAIAAAVGPKARLNPTT